MHIKKRKTNKLLTASKPQLQITHFKNKTPFVKLQDDEYTYWLLPITHPDIKDALRVDFKFRIMDKLLETEALAPLDDDDFTDLL